MDIKKCLHCGSEEGYYTKDYAKGNARTYYLANGEFGDNEAMYDNLDHRCGKVAYCSQCHKKMFNMEYE